MTKELKFKSISIGFDFKTFGIGIGFLFNKESSLFAISIVGIFLLIKFPEIKRYDIKNLVTRDYDIGYLGKQSYNLVPDKNYKPKSIFIRNRQSNEFEEVFRFKFIFETKGFEGVLVYPNKNTIHPIFYSSDEYYFWSPMTYVKGYINTKNQTFNVLSIVD